MIIKPTKRILNSDKICRSYSDLNFGVTFLEHSVLWHLCIAKYGLKKLETSFYGVVLRIFRHLELFKSLSVTHECKSQTNRHSHSKCCT